MKKFITGFIFGTLTTIGALTGAMYTFHKIIIQPLEDQEEKEEHNRLRAQRKQHAAHHG